jgi:hypothetical protein
MAMRLGCVAPRYLEDTVGRRRGTRNPRTAKLSLGKARSRAIPLNLGDAAVDGEAGADVT